MQRTYKSKKDIGGGLDHRDMLYNMDEKSSAFDAFYIQNIKQTKREQSCMGSSNNYGAASNKVRKRKYVKRLVKEVEPPLAEPVRESISGSVFLTPDKSLRVNKAPDLFDQLLKSSPACSDIKDLKKVVLFDQILAGTPKEPKKYNRKKKLIKKFNYSSDESSVSDKENSHKNNENSTQNTTDIKAHELIVEKEATPSPKFDESINNIVRKLSLINNIKDKNSTNSLKKSFKWNKNRLTKNFQSPLVKTSPLSSTPFTDKTRSKSIYNFSPIPIGNFEDSPDYVTINEDDNEINKSVVFVPKNNSNALKISQDEKTSAHEIIVDYSNKFKGNSNPLFSSEADTQEDLKSAEVSDKTSPKNAENKDSNSIQVSSLQISEMEPFLGFSDDTIAKVNKDLFIDEEKDNSIIISSGKVSKIAQKSKDISNDKSKYISEKENKTASLIEYSTPPEPFFGFSEQTKSIVNICAVNDSMPSRPFLGFTDIVSDKNETAISDGYVSQNTSSDKTQNNSVFNITAAEYGICKELKLKEDDLKTINVDSYVDDGRQISQNMDPDIGQISSTTILFTTGNIIHKKPVMYGVTPKNNRVVDSDDDDDDQEISEYVDSNKDHTSLSSLSSQSEDDVSVRDRTSEEQEDKYDNKRSLYDTCHSDTSFSEENKPIEPFVLEKMDIDMFKKYYKSMPEKHSAKPVVAIEKMNIDLFKKYYENMPNYDEEENSAEDMFKKYYKSMPEKHSGEPVVAIEKMNIDLFKKYYEDMPNYDEEENSAELSEEISESFASFDDTTYNVDVQSEENSQSIYTETDLTDTESDSDSNIQNTSSENRDRSIGDKFVSFVTTRRRIEPINGSEILVLDDSQDSTSTECDRTVLSNKRVSLASPKNLNEDPDISMSANMPMEEKTIKTKLSESPDNRISNVTTRKSALCRISNTHESIDISKTPDLKPGIILQPGKKWERSLSIYRRMTVNDHFEHSMLEDEDLHAKGRKYRQSVIYTMEMQDKSSLHNESIHNRRSTFVSKPSRSTIRIVKETNNTSRLSLSSTAVFDDLKGFLEDCDDTIVELSKLSLVDDHDVTVIEKFHEASRIATARDYVLRRCNQSDTIPFDECYPDPLLKNCRKIGEGVYGEVFLWRAPDGRARVMKVVPIAGTVKVNGESQKDFHEIIAEIVIAMELSALRAPIAEIDCHFNEGKDVDELDLHSVENATDVFNEVLAVKCVYGSYPSRLLDLWELYDETKGSENDNPAILPVDQQYIVLELANAGQDLESYQFNSAEQAHALFLQVAFALAVGEEAFQFEHRDLHWGNVLIAPTDQKYATFVLRGRAHRVLRRGVAATIIDYSLSRVALPLGAERAALYNDLAADDGLFGAVGDYQFEVYRLMRDKLGNDWKNFEPYTNILWLHYTVDKMITALRYKRTNTKTHKQYINKLKGIKERILGYGSAAQFVLTDNEF